MIRIEAGGGGCLGASWSTAGGDHLVAVAVVFTITIVKTINSDSEDDHLLDYHYQQHHHHHIVVVIVAVVFAITLVA